MGRDLLIEKLMSSVSDLCGKFSDSEHLVKGKTVIIEGIFMTGGCNIEGEDESWDFGTGAGFYVDATEDPWKTNYRMYSYIKDEVTLLLGSSAIFG